MWKCGFLLRIYYRTAEGTTTVRLLVEAYFSWDAVCCKGWDTGEQVVSFREKARFIIQAVHVKDQEFKSEDQHWLPVRVLELKKETKNLCPSPTPRDLTKPLREHQVFASKQHGLGLKCMGPLMCRVFSIYSWPSISPGFKSKGLTVCLVLCHFI